MHRPAIGGNFPAAIGSEIGRREAEESDGGAGQRHVEVEILGLRCRDAHAARWSSVNVVMGEFESRKGAMNEFSGTGIWFIQKIAARHARPNQPVDIAILPQFAVMCRDAVALPYRRRFTG